MIPPPLPLYEKTAWNAWWTLLWAFALIVIWQLTLTTAMTLFLLPEGFLFKNADDPDAIMGKIFELSTDGDVVGICAFATIFVVCPLCWLLGKVRPHWSGWEYLGVKSVQWSQWPLWAAVTYGMGTLFGYLAPSLGIEEMDDSMVEMAEPEVMREYIYCKEVLFHQAGCLI